MRISKDTPREVVRWWLDALAECILPERLRQALAPEKPSRLHIVPGDTELLVMGGKDIVARFPFDPDLAALVNPDQSRLEEVSERSEPVSLVLPRSRVLSHAMTLPAAAEENLRRVLAFEMDRRTPFKADEVYFDACVTERDQAARKIQVQFAIAQRDYVDALLGLIEHQLRLRAEHIEVEGSRWPFDLLPPERRTGRSRRERAVRWVVAGVTVALLVAAVAIPLVEKARKVATLDAELATAKRKAQAIENLKARVRSTAEASAYLVERKLRHPSALELVDEITRIFPDDAWVQQFELTPREIQLRGEAQQASALVPLLEDSPLLQNARFQASVTKNPRTGRERYVLAADISERK